VRVKVVRTHLEGRLWGGGHAGVDAATLLGRVDRQVDQLAVDTSLGGERTKRRTFDLTPDPNPRSRRSHGAALSGRQPHEPAFEYVSPAVAF
jgi:hypothetical protein